MPEKEGEKDCFGCIYLLKAGEHSQRSWSKVALIIIPNSLKVQLILSCHISWHAVWDIQLEANVG